jgi:hypothetical protein
MSPARHSKFLLQSLLIANLLADAAVCSGCGSDGAGSIHIDSPKARKKLMQSGAGIAPTATAKPALPEINSKSISRAAIKTPVRNSD